MAIRVDEVKNTHSILDQYDILLLDLDGTIFAGQTLIPRALEGISGRERRYVTNNASRSPQQVAEHLQGLGVSADPSEVMTSAQAALAQAKNDGLLQAGNKALILGSDSFKSLAEQAGLKVVASADDNPELVFHGFNPHTGWELLSEAALALQRGASYYATNLDSTLPNERGFLVGNGSMVNAVVHATGVHPKSAGKPGPAMFHAVMEGIEDLKPLAVGDRLDTDIAGGIAAGMDTLCVLTGVGTPAQLLETKYRPTYIAANLQDETPEWSAELVQDGYGNSTIVITALSEATPELNSAAAISVAAPIAWKFHDQGVANFVLKGADELAQATIDAWNLDEQRKAK